MKACSRAGWINPYFSRVDACLVEAQKQDRSPLFLLAIGPEGSLLEWPFIERPGSWYKRIMALHMMRQITTFPLVKTGPRVNWLDLCTICLVPFFLPGSRSRKIRMNMKGWSAGHLISQFSGPSVLPVWLSQRRMDHLIIFGRKRLGEVAQILTL